jgi:hypothetical protein
MNTKITLLLTLPMNGKDLGIKDLYGLIPTKMQFKS